MTRTVQDDIAAVARASAVPTILQVVSRMTGMGFTAVARVTDTTWTVCAVRDQINFGLQPGGELKLESTICNEIRQHQQPVIFGHASQNPQFRDHHTVKMYGFESYLSIPIFRLNGEFFGTLCAIDPKPALLESDPNLLTTLELFAQLIGEQLDTQDQLETSQLALAKANETAQLREQLVAVLGHDLRQPLHSIRMGAQLIEKTSVEPVATKALKNISRSVARMNEMIENVLDFARGKLGGGIPVEIHPEERLGDQLRQVVSEVHTSHPERPLASSIDISGVVRCDGARIAQLLSNLLGNAVAHGEPGTTVELEAKREDGQLEIAVKNSGEISPQAMAGMFKPFSRPADSASRPGLGLGLYIAQQIAQSHGGTLEARSQNGATELIFRMPA